jgi:hypothetical protein
MVLISTFYSGSGGLGVARSLFFCVAFCTSLFVPLSVLLRCTTSDYLFGIFHLYYINNQYLRSVSTQRKHIDGGGGKEKEGKEEVDGRKEDEEEHSNPTNSVNTRHMCGLS